MVWKIANQLREYDSYEKAYENFEWDFPDDYNLAWDMVQKHENDDEKVALYYGQPGRNIDEYTFRDMDLLSNQVANGLENLGIGKGDRVGVVIGQKPENLVTHLANWKLGSISLLMPSLLGPDSMKYRINDAEPKAVLVDDETQDLINDIRSKCPSIEYVISADGGNEEEDIIGFDDIYQDESDAYEIEGLTKDSPAFIIYTSGTTGNPKGVIHKHEFGAGPQPGVYMMWDHQVDQVDVVWWMQGDWNWVTGPYLLSAAWHNGRPFVASPMGEFDANQVFEILEEFDITNPWLPPTAIRMLTNVDNPDDQYDLSLKMLSSSGSAVTPEIVDWAETELGVELIEGYGQTEQPAIAANCPAWFNRCEGSLGKPIPGYDVSIVNEDRNEVETGEVGEIAVGRNNPCNLDKYWNRPNKTDSVFKGDLYLTTDLGRMDEDGYIYFESRKDDVIITSGYRVGPEEVESAILKHEDVEETGVIGVPHETRGEIIKAYIKTYEDVNKPEELKEDIRQMVKQDLAKYEYPREIEFTEELPETETGKIRRVELREWEDAE